MLDLIRAVSLIETEVDLRVVSCGELAHQRRRVSEFGGIECGGERTAGSLFETGEAGAQVPRGGRVDHRGPVERHLPAAIAALGPFRFRGAGGTEAILPVPMLVRHGESPG